MKFRLTWFVIAAMVAGPLFGLLLARLLDPASISGATDILALITTAFLRLIKMIISPLVFCTLTAGIARMEGVASIARVGARTIGWFLLATMLAMAVGLALVQLFKPGLGLMPPVSAAALPTAAKFQLKDMLEHVIPSSVVQAMANNEILQVVVFSLLFGTAAAGLGAKVAGCIELIEQIGNVILRMTRYIMALAPLAIFAALASSVLTQGLGVLGAYAKFIGVFYLALLIWWSLLAAGLYAAIGRRTTELLRAVKAPLLLAFSTASSEAAYPQTLQSLEEFGVSPRIAAFVLPLGYSFNLQGSALYCTFGILFIAQIYRIELSLAQQVTMLLILMVTSKGIAGVPRAALMVVAASLSYFGLPEQGLVFVVAVDHLLDMGRTATNVIGNAGAAALVAKWGRRIEGERSLTLDTREQAISQAQRLLAHDAEDYADDAVVPAIAQSSLFTFKSFAEMSETFAGRRTRNVYSRTTNPTVSAFERKIAALEHTDDAIGFPSGMAAISGAVLGFAQPGDRILCVRHVYPDAYRFFETLLKKLNVVVDYVDGGDLRAVEAHLPSAKLLYLESPTSWTMQALDVAALATLARKYSVISIIDNSWATPLFQRPITSGIDLVLHSASKYIGGHSDTVAGVLAGRTDLISHIRRTICPYLGAKLGPFEAWLLLRGLRTLPVRMLAHEASALEIARRLSSHPLITAVHHPALIGALPSGLTGTSGLFSFDAAAAIDIPALCDALEFFQLGVSWGGHESLVVPALVARAQAAGPNSAIDFNVSDRTVRLHVGLEGTDTLWSDLVQSLARAAR